MKTGWKVLKKKSRTSSVVPLSKGGLKFPRGKTVTPKRGNGPICVFTKRQAAEEFVKEKYDKYDIYRCKFSPSQREFVYSHFDPERIHVLSLPKYTALADRVICLE